MTKSLTGKWEILLADLALILFIVALGGLVTMPINAKDKSADTAPAETNPEQLAIAPSQALYRSTKGGISLREWLEGQTLDPRVTLTIFVDYRPDDAARGLTQAASMIDEAQTAGVRVRTVMRDAERADIYASLAFDGAGFAGDNLASEDSAP